MTKEERAELDFLENLLKKQKEEEKKRLEEQQNKLEEERKKLEEEGNQNQTTRRSSRR